MQTSAAKSSRDIMASNTRGRGTGNRSRPRMDRTKPDRSDEEVLEELEAFGDVFGVHEAFLDQGRVTQNKMPTSAEDLEKWENELKKQAERLEKRETEMEEKDKSLQKDKRIFLDAKRKYLDWEKENDQLRVQMRKLEETLRKLGLSWVVKDALSQG